MSKRRGSKHKRRYDPYAFADPRRRHTTRRRHDPRFSLGGGKGILGKLARGAVVALGGNLGGLAGSFVSNKLPQTNVTIPGTQKNLNLAGEGLAVLVGGFGGSAPGLLGDGLEGFAGGMAAASDPEAAAATGVGLGGATQAERGDYSSSEMLL